MCVARGADSVCVTPSSSFSTPSHATLVFHGWTILSARYIYIYIYVYIDVFVLTNFGGLIFLGHDESGF